MVNPRAIGSTAMYRRLALAAAVPLALILGLPACGEREAADSEFERDMESIGQGIEDAGEEIEEGFEEAGMASPDPDD